MTRFGARSFPAAAAFGALVAVAACDGGSDAPAPSPTVPAPAPAPAPPAGARCTEEGEVLEYGFFAFYEPVSYSGSPDPRSEGFDEHLGYEADLLDALEAMDGAGLAFNRRGIGVWPGIWLLPATPEYDLVGGGITILEERTRDASGTPTVSFTAGHIEFGHSVLVRASDAGRLAQYGDLTSDIRVGVSIETSTEARFLEIVGLANEDGVLLAGARITTPAGVVVTDGSDAYRIAAGRSSLNLAGRAHLEPPSTGYPQVVFFDAETLQAEQVEALASGRVDALAGDQIWNRTMEAKSAGALAVTAVDTLVQLGGFAVDQDDEDLLACLDDKLDYLTGERSIGFGEWLVNPSVFRERAEAWTP